MSIDVEFIYTRDSGQRVFIKSRVRMLMGCGCDGGKHAHADDFFLDASRDVDTDDPVTLEGKEVLDVEEEALAIAYEDAS